MLHDPTFIGTVQDVHGTTVSVELTDETVTGLTFVGGEGYRIGQVGSFVKIPLGYVDLYSPESRQYMRDSGRVCFKEPQGIIARQARQ